MSTDVGGNFIGDEEEAGVDDVQSEHSGDHHYAVKKVCSSMSVAIPRYDRTEHTKEPLGSDDCSMPTARELGRTVDSPTLYQESSTDADGGIGRT